MSKWARSKFKKILCSRWQNNDKIFCDAWDRIFDDVGEYFVTCSWINDIMNESMDENKMDDFLNEHLQQTFFWENWTKEIGWKQFMLVYFEKFDTWNAQITFQAITSYQIYSSSASSKPYKMLN